MTSPDQNQLIADLARDIIAQTAPQELPLFRATSTAYFKNPDKVLKTQKNKDEMLGFGGAEIVLFLTPSILAIVTQVVCFVTAEVQKTVASESASVIHDLVKKLFKKFRPEEKEQECLPVLTSEQLVQIRRLVYTEAQQVTGSDDKANLLANAIVGSLATVPS